MRFELKKINLKSRSGREWLMLLFSLLLAFFMWTVHNLSENTSSYYSFKLKVVSNLEGRSDVSTSDGSVVVSGLSSGFYILQSVLSSQVPELQIMLDRKYLHSYASGEDVFYVKGADLVGELASVLKDRIAVEMVITDTVFFHFPKMLNKKVPVAADLSVTYRSQYMPFGEMHFSPDSVIVYGEKDLLDAIDSVVTENIRVRYASEDIQGVSRLKSVAGVRFSEKEVFYSQSVGRYVEHSIKVQPEVINLPEDKEMFLIPGRC